MIRTVRQRKGWRQRDLAEAGHVSRRRSRESSEATSARCRSTRSARSAPVSTSGSTAAQVARRRSRSDDEPAALGPARVGDAHDRRRVPGMGDRTRGVVLDLRRARRHRSADVHPGRRALLVIELKTDIVDVGEMLGTLDKKRRLAWRSRKTGAAAPDGLGLDRGRQSRTNERRIAEFRAMLRSAFPADGRQMRAWLRDPVGSIAGLSFWSIGTVGSQPMTPRRRMRST